MVSSTGTVESPHVFSVNAGNLIDSGNTLTAEQQAALEKQQRKEETIRITLTAGIPILVAVSAILIFAVVWKRRKSRLHKQPKNSKSSKQPDIVTTENILFIKTDRIPSDTAEEEKSTTNEQIHSEEIKRDTQTIRNLDIYNETQRIRTHHRIKKSMQPVRSRMSLTRPVLIDIESDTFTS